MVTRGRAVMLRIFVEWEFFLLSWEFFFGQKILMVTLGRTVMLGIFVEWEFFFVKLGIFFWKENFVSNSRTCRDVGDFCGVGIFFC